MKTSTLLLSLSALLIFTGCEEKQGTFLDIEGIQYHTDTLSGITDGNFSFEYVDGEHITFSVGDIDLPTVLAQENITLFTLAGTDDINNQTLINITQFLESLDVDGNRSNGVNITEEILRAGEGLSIDFDSESEALFLASIEELFTSLNGLTPVDPQTAITNLIDSLKDSGLFDKFNKDENEEVKK